MTRLMPSVKTQASQDMLPGFRRLSRSSSMRWLWSCQAPSASRLPSASKVILVAGLHLPDPPAHDPVPAGELLRRPFCSRVPEPPVAGYLSEDNLVLEAPCRYSLFETRDAARCLQGGWLLVMGSSNSLLQFNSLVDFLAPQEYVHDRKGELIGVSAVVDVIISDGKLVEPLWLMSSSTSFGLCSETDLKLPRLLPVQCWS